MSRSGGSGVAKEHGIPLFLAAVALFVGTSSCRERPALALSDREFAVALDWSHSVKRGGSAIVPITVKRTRTSGPVAIEFSSLPTGITITDPGEIPSEDDMRIFTVTADASAELVEAHVVRVTASHGGTKVTEPFYLTVSAK